MLFEGTAELISEPRERVTELARQVYLRYVGEQGLLAADVQSWLVDPENTIIRLKTARRMLW